MKVVSNTSPVLNLAIVGQEGLLESLFGKVVIPRAVHSELARFDPSRLQLNRIKAWLEVRLLDSDALALALSSELDPGEAEAIALAVQAQADLILLDELKGRAVARRMGLRCMGVLGVISEAKRRQLIPSVKPVLNSMMHEAGFWIHPSLYQRVLEEAKEQ